MNRMWTSLRRLGQVSFVAARHGIAWAFHGRSRRRAPESGPQRLCRLFEDLGGTFIKFGQMLALQPDLVPAPYCDALLKLLDRVEPFPLSEVERILTEDLGRRPAEIFDRFDGDPVATASIGQVHLATLEGRKVAVKVRRPSVEREFENDIRLMEAAIGTIRRLRLRPVEWLIEPMSEFVKWTREELDFRYEARYARALHRQAARNPAQYVPEVVDRYTTCRTLVTEYLEGVSLLHYLRACERSDEAVLLRVAELGFDRRRFAANVIDNFLGDVFRHGIYHADLHPANLLILENNVVGYVDFGIIGVMSAYSRHHLMTMTLAVATGDVETLSTEYLAVTEHGRGSDYEALRRGLARLSRGWYGRNGGAGLQANFTRVMGEMLQLSRRTRIMPERDIIKYIRSAIAIDGLIIRFAPGFDLGEHLSGRCSRLLLGQALRSRLTPDSLFDLWNASNQLWSDGSAGMVRAFDRLITDDRWRRTGKPRNAGWRGRALFMIGVAAAALLLGGPASTDGDPGLDVGTAGLLLLGAAAAWVFNTLGRLAGPTG